MTASIALSIEDDIRLELMSFFAIAKKYGVTFSEVSAVWEKMCEQE